ncbi:MAG: AbrB/MazE/SpoVT family DNA-binding domain-containing protein [Patescibacteria group bacterium]
MNYTTAMTIKGQITIPNFIRKKMQIQKNTKLSVFLDEKSGEIRVKPLPNFFELAGSMNVKNKKDVMKAREYMENNYERI